MHSKKLYGTATVGTKGQIVIPADAREELNIGPGDRLYIAGSSESKVLICLKEEQLQEYIDKATRDVETTKSLIETFRRDNK